MYLRFLFERLDGLSPEAKFVLLMSLKCYGTLVLPLKRATELAQDLGLGVKVVSKVLEQLVKKGYLTKVKAEVQRKRGRNSIGYSALEPLRNLQNTWLANNRNVPHERIISDLIESGAAESSLTPADKLLLAVLLANADDSGVIRNVGTADLMALTGMLRDRVGYRMDNLKGQGYIRSSVPGVTMPSIFGVTSGYIFLNLLHSKFQNTLLGGVIILLLAELEYGENHFREAKWICEVIRQASRSDKGAIDTSKLNWLVECFGFKGEPKGLLKFFDGINSVQEVRYLQVKLNDYASHLLSNFWEELVNLEWDSEVVFDKVFADISCISANFRKTIGASSEELVSLARFLFSVSLRIAKEVRRLLLSAGSHPYENMDCAILPYEISRASRGSGYAIDLCIEIFSKEIDGNLGYIKLGGQRFERLGAVEAGQEEELTFNTRRAAGLISRNYSL